MDSLSYRDELLNILSFLAVRDIQSLEMALIKSYLKRVWISELTICIGDQKISDFYRLLLPAIERGLCDLEDLNEVVNYNKLYKYETHPNLILDLDLQSFIEWTNSREITVTVLNICIIDIHDGVINSLCQMVNKVKVLKVHITVHKKISLEMMQTITQCFKDVHITIEKTNNKCVNCTKCTYSFIHCFGLGLHDLLYNIPKLA